MYDAGLHGDALSPSLPGDRVLLKTGGAIHIHGRLAARGPHLSRAQALSQVETKKRILHVGGGVIKTGSGK